MDKLVSVTVPARRAVYWVFACIGTAVLVVLAIYFHRMGTVPAIIVGLFGGLFAVGGIKQTIVPTPFATLTGSGVAFPLSRVKEIAWSRIIDVQLGPTSITRGSETTVMWQPMLVLRLNKLPDESLLGSLAAAANTIVRVDGTIDRMIDMSLSTVPTAEFIAMMAPFRPSGSQRSSSNGLPSAGPSDTRRSPDATNAFAAVKTSKRRLTFGIVFSGFAAALFIGSGLWFSYRSFRAQTWPTTSGVIITSNITTSRSQHSVSYEPHIVYRYTVDGRDYVGSRYAFSYRSDRSAIQGVIMRYRPGTETTVFYEPDHPENAILEQSSSVMPLALGAFGMMALFIGILAWRARNASV